MGDAEAENKSVNLKWLASGEQAAMSQAEVLQTIETLKTKISTLKSN